MARSRFVRHRRTDNGNPRQRARILEAHLLPAVVSAEMLREIDAAIPDLLRQNISWGARVGEEAIQARNIDEFLEDSAEETRFDELTLEAWDANNSIYLGCDSEGSYFECWFNTDNSTEFTSLTNAIEGAFRRNRRRTAVVPRLVARPKRFLRTSKLAFGKSVPSYWSELNWHKIGEDIISRVASHAITFVVGGAGGAIAGFFAGRASA